MQPFLTQDGSFTAKHQVHGETFHSDFGALRETQDLYVRASGYNAAVESGADIAVLDVGLGLGLNALSTIERWWRADKPGNLYVHSLEIEEALVAHLMLGNGAWQLSWSKQWFWFLNHVGRVENHQWAGGFSHPKSNKQCTWLIECTDASSKTLTESPFGPWNYIWHDPFSPKNNPDLWTKEWFEKLKAVSSPATVLMTYSASRTAKDSLDASGWNYSLIPTTTGKRHWLKAGIA